MLLTVEESIRLVLLYSHLILCALAIAQVLKADLDIVTGMFTREGLRAMAHQVSMVLTLLWLTGLAIIYLDTGFDPAILAERPKLLLKLMCVVVLTANGMVLHRISFPVLTKAGPLSTWESMFLASTGALSTSHWLMAAFIGIARPLGRIPIESLAMFYGVICLATLLVSLMCSPTIRRRLMDWQLAQALRQL